MEALLTPEELATRYQISVKRIYALVRAGKLHAVRLPGSRLLRFDPDSLKPEAKAAPTKTTSVLRFPKTKKIA